MSKLLALDIGDQWTGIGISDGSRLLAKPYKTVATGELENNLEQIINQENIETIIVGHPKTMRGTESEQTKKVIAHFEKLKKYFTGTEFILWDERLSSKRASSISGGKTKEDKLKSHAIAASFVLDTYLTYLLQKNQ